MPRKIITVLKLDEISGVDNPAQPGATVLIAKRAPSPTPTGPKETSAMFKNRDELLAAIAKFDATTATVAELTSITKSATALKAEDALTDAIREAAGITKSTGPDPAVAALQERVDELLKTQGMGAKERELYDKMSPEEKKKHLAKSDGERAEVVEKAFATDPVVYTTLDGVDVRKSAGDVTLALAKQLDEQTRRLAKAEATATDAVLTKRAEDETGNLAGDEKTRKALLKAVDGITDAETRAEVLKTIASANEAAGGAFTPVGTKTTVKKSANPEAALEDLAKAYAKDHKVDFHKAYQEVINTPEGKVLYDQSLEA